MSNSLRLDTSKLPNRVEISTQMIKDLGIARIVKKTIRVNSELIYIRHTLVLKANNSIIANCSVHLNNAKKSQYKVVRVQDLASVVNLNLVHSTFNQYERYCAIMLPITGYLPFNPKGVK